ncbi:MAG: hypothetical protein E7004_02470 [Alphaproteobacteria bacterium]|nr:hypothetical protein [Alphaproteobacteria bacterium]
MSQLFLAIVAIANIICFAYAVIYGVKFIFIKRKPNFDKDFWNENKKYVKENFKECFKMTLGEFKWFQKLGLCLVVVIAPISVLALLFSILSDMASDCCDD